MEPFQIVRMGCLDCSGTGLFRRSLRLPPATLSSMAHDGKAPAAASCRQRRTIGRLWRDAVAAGRTPRLLVERDGRLAARSRGRRPAAVDELANGLLALGVRKGDAFAILGADDARVGAVRLRARPHRRDRRADLREQLAEGRAVRRRALGGGRRARRGRGAAGEDRGRSASRTRSRSPTSTGCATRGRELRSASTRTRSPRPRPRSARTTSSRTSTRPARPGRRRAA